MATADAGFISKDNPLYELALTVDVTQVPDKVKCKICEGFLLNAEMSDCCSTAMCEKCVKEAITMVCPRCKHQPFSSTPKKALRNTAKAILKSMQASAEASKAPVAPTSGVTDQSLVTAVEEEAQNIVLEPTKPAAQVGPSANHENKTDNTVEEADRQEQVTAETIQQADRESAETNMDNQDMDDDDDIEINVGEAYDASQLEPIQPGTPDEQDALHHETGRKNSAFQQPTDQKKEQPFSGATDVKNGNGNGTGNNLFGGNPNGHNVMNVFDMNVQPSMDPSMMQNMMLMMQNGSGTFDANTFMNMMHTNPVFFQNSMNYMQSWNMNGMAAGNLNGMSSWFPNNMVGQGGFPSMNNMFNNGAGFAQQQYQQFANADSRIFNQNGKFSRGNRRGRGRRGGYYQQDNPNSYHMMSQFPNNFGQYSHHQSVQDVQSQFLSQHSQHSGTQITNNDDGGNPEPETEPDNDDFAPGGQEDVEEALGDEYSKVRAEVQADPAVGEVTDRSGEPTVAQEKQDPTPVVSVRELSPFAAPLAAEEDEEEASRVEAAIPEAYREDIDYVMAPPSAPVGPSQRDTAFRTRGHGRFPSRSRGSFQSPSGYAPHSPVRQVSQTQVTSQASPVNKGSGVVGAPTGPRAMRQQDAATTNRMVTRSDSDMGLKIMGRASTHVNEVNYKDDTARTATPKSGYEDYDDDDGNNNNNNNNNKSRLNEYRVSRRDVEQRTSRSDEYMDHDRERDRKRRKSSRKDEMHEDYEIQDPDQRYTRADSAERSSSHRSSRRDREKRDKDRYAGGSSRHKPSSRHYEDALDSETNGHGEPAGSAGHRSSRKDPFRRDEERDRERDNRDHERSERDKHRKRSRHDREREGDYEDEDETENRRRSRKHKKDQGSSRKDRDREHDETDLGMRISGRSSHRNSEVASAVLTPQPDKDPHTLEREARNRERMLKEQQRRENAAKGTLSGGRKINYKYEDEIEPRLSKSRRR